MTPVDATDMSSADSHPLAPIQIMARSRPWQSVRGQGEQGNRGTGDWSPRRNAVWRKEQKQGSILCKEIASYESISLRPKGLASYGAMAAYRWFSFLTSSLDGCLREGGGGGRGPAGGAGRIGREKTVSLEPREPAELHDWPFAEDCRP